MAESFSLQIAAFVEKAKANAEQVIQKTAIDLLTAVVDRSPVGNPELWASNAIASNYNAEVSEFNAGLRNDPANLNKAGRLKRGLKINDSMEIKAPAGYVGGRFRANWQVTFNAPAAAALDAVDPSGSATVAKGTQMILAFDSAVGSIWMMNNVPYAQALEYGHSKQAPAGVVRISVAEFQTFIDDAARALV